MASKHSAHVLNYLFIIISIKLNQDLYTATVTIQNKTRCEVRHETSHLNKWARVKGYADGGSCAKGPGLKRKGRRVPTWVTRHLESPVLEPRHPAMCRHPDPNPYGLSNECISDAKRIPRTARELFVRLPKSLYSGRKNGRLTASGNSISFPAASAAPNANRHGAIPGAAPCMAFRDSASPRHCSPSALDPSFA